MHFIGRPKIVFMGLYALGSSSAIAGLIVLHIGVRYFQDEILAWGSSISTPSVLGALVKDIRKHWLLVFWHWLCACFRTEVNIDQPRNLSDRSPVQESPQIDRPVAKETVATESDNLNSCYSDNFRSGHVTLHSSGKNHRRWNEPAIATAGTTNVHVMNMPTESNMSPIQAIGSQASTSSSPSPLNRVESTTTVFIPDGESSNQKKNIVIASFSKLKSAGVKWWKSPIVLQTKLSIDAHILAKLEELAKILIHLDNEITLQIGGWGIFYGNAGRVELWLLERDDVPVILEARWHKNGIIVRGINLTGAQIRVATKETSTTLRSAGIPSEGRGNLDELCFPNIEGLDVKKLPHLHALKVVEVDGCNIQVRSTAVDILPTQGQSSSAKAFGDRFQKNSSTIKMKSRFQIFQPKTPQRKTLQKHLDADIKPISDLKTNGALIVEHWKGVTQNEMLDCQKKVLYHLQQVASKTDNCKYQPSHFASSLSSSDQEYWQRGLHDMNEVLQRNMSSSDSSTLLSIRGSIKFFLGEFESAVQDFDLAINLNIKGQPSTLLERAIAKGVLGKYSEAIQDVSKINVNLNYVMKYQTCLEQIRIFNELKAVQAIPDLLTGDEWNPDLHSLPSESSNFSPHIQGLMEQRSMFGSRLEFEIEASRSHWTPLNFPSLGPQRTKFDEREAPNLHQIWTPRSVDVELDVEPDWSEFDDLLEAPNLCQVWVPSNVDLEPDVLPHWSELAEN